MNNDSYGSGLRAISLTHVYHRHQKLSGIFLLQSKSGKKTGTPISGKLDAARELGMIEKGFSLNGANKRMSLDRSSQYKNRPRDSGQDSSNFANTKDSNR